MTFTGVYALFVFLFTASHAHYFTTTIIALYALSVTTTFTDLYANFVLLFTASYALSFTTTITATARIAQLVECPLLEREVVGLNSGRTILKV